jgi:hypothetical protein
MTVRIDVMDEDSAFDDLLLTNQTFQVGVCWIFGLRCWSPP